MSLLFCKATATGNDFIYLDDRSGQLQTHASQVLGSSSPSQWAEKLCDRHFGIGADGLVILLEKDGGYVWDFYNSDGSSAEMCGNATRGLFLFAQSLGICPQDQFTFTSRAGTIGTRLVSSQQVEVTMTPAHLLERQVPVNSSFLADLIDSGVPHFVVEVERLDDRALLLSLVQSLRHHPLAGPAGANVTFRLKTGNAALQSTSFERGVEDFTLSCGTGAVAAAYSQFLQTPANPTLQVTVPGGLVTVDVARLGEPKLTGPAQILFTGEITQRWTR